MKRRVSLFLCMIMLLMTMNVAIAEITIQPRYSYTTLIGVLFELTAGMATAGGTIEPHNDQETRVVARLQQKIDGIWNTIGTWRGHADSGICEAGGTKRVDVGYQYRVKVTGYVYDTDGSLLESTSIYSDVKTYGTIIS